MTSGSEHLRPASINWLVAGQPNAFRDRYRALTDQEWLDLLVRSVANPKIDGIDFPGFPTPEFQQEIHGSADEVALREGLARGITRALSGSMAANATIRTAARQTVIERYDLARVCLPQSLSLLRRLS